MLCQECSVVSTTAVAADDDVFPPHVAANDVVIIGSAGGIVGAHPCPTKTVQSVADPTDDGIGPAEAMTSSPLTACQRTSTVAGRSFQRCAPTLVALAPLVAMQHNSTLSRQHVRTSERQHGSTAVHGSTAEHTTDRVTFVLFEDASPVSARDRSFAAV